MSFLTVNRPPLSEDFTRELASTNTILFRIAEALERLAPPIAAQPPPHQATLSDLRRTDPITIHNIRGELDTYAQDHGVVLDSDAFLESIHNYEQQISEHYGQDAILELPWNKAAKGSIFQDYGDYKRRRQVKEASQPGEQGVRPEESAR